MATLIMTSLLGDVFDLLLPNDTVLMLISTDSPECIGELMHLHSSQKLFIMCYNYQLKIGL